MPASDAPRTQPRELSPAAQALADEHYEPAYSPIVLAAAGGDAVLPQRQVLVNLGPVVPRGFERFERLIDVVTGDDADRQHARSRWRHYAERGYAITRHDMAGGAT